MRDPIIIVGMPRSGTSLTAGILHACGVWGGRKKDFLKADEKNPTGYFENLKLWGDLLQNVVKGFRGRTRLFSNKRTLMLGWDKTDVKYDDKNQNLTYVRSKGHNIPEDSPWFLKVPFMFVHSRPHEWVSVFPEAKWIFTMRNYMDVICSQRKLYSDFDAENRDYMNGSVLLDIEALKENSNYKEIWPFRAIKDPDLTAYKNLVAWVGAEWNDDAVRKFINLDLYHHRHDPHALPALVPTPTPK